MRKWMLLSILIIAALAIAPAQAQGNKFKAYAALDYVVPTGSTDLDIEGIVDSVEASDEVGWSLGFEWRLGKWGGLQFDYTDVSHDIVFQDESIASTSMTPLSASFNFHLVHTRVIDFYFGPTISYVMWDDITTSDGETISADSEWGYGAQIGADFSIFKSVAIVTGLRYISLEVGADDESIGVDPFFATVGVAIRWGGN